MMPDRITSFSVKGFRNLRSVSVPTVPGLTLLIGGNGSGKSSFIHCLELLSWMQRGRLQEFVAENGGGDDQLFMGSEQTDAIEVSCVAETGKGRYCYEVELCYRPVGDALFIKSERWGKKSLGNDKLEQWQTASTQELRQGDESVMRLHQDEAAQQVNKLLGGLEVFQFQNTSARATINKYCDLSDCRCLRSDGGNLAAVLYDIKKMEPMRYQLIIDQIQRFVPSFGDFELMPLESSGKIMFRWHSRFSKKNFGAHLTSDGSLRLFCLVTLLSLPAERLPTVLCIDEPELGLHPYAVELVADLIKEVAFDRQVILATQSPYFVDCFDLENIIIAESRAGETQMQTLPRSEYQMWLDDDYQLSDIWLSRSVGGLV